MSSSKFKLGNPGGPGRPRGSRNKLSEAFIEAVCADFQKHGIAAIEAARAESPLGYVRMIAGLMPLKQEVTGLDGGPQQYEMIDRPPAETREEWVARRQRELAVARAAIGSPHN